MGPTAGFLLHQAGERRQAVPAVPVAAELAAVIGLDRQPAQLHAAAAEVGRQPIGKQQGVGGVVRRARGRRLFSAATLRASGARWTGKCAGSALRGPLCLPRGSAAATCARCCAWCRIPGQPGGCRVAGRRAPWGSGDRSLDWGSESYHRREGARIISGGGSFSLQILGVNILEPFCLSSGISHGASRPAPG